MQSELTPGLYVSPYVPVGTAFKLSVEAFGFGDGLAGSGTAVAISTKDWESIPGHLREQFLDDMTREFAQGGMAQLEAYLRSAASRQQRSE